MLVSALILVLTTIPVYLKLGSEFMPPLYEGSLLFMPTTLPGLSVTGAQELMQKQDQIFKELPRSRSRVRQSRPRGNRHRSGALFHDGNNGSAQTRKPNGRKE